MKKSNVLSLSIILFILLLPFSKITAQRPFITKWKATTNKQLTIPTTGGGYNYSIKWFDDASPLLLVGSATSQTGSYTINGLISTHIYRIEITGSFPRIWFN